jgi:ABC-2 type transport system ATP-binding protein
MTDPAARCRCEGLAKAYGSRRVLAACSLGVDAGEIVGLVGENGTGKSTLVRSLLGFIRPDHGRIWLHPSVGYCPQDDYLHGRLTVAEHLRLARDVYGQHHPIDPAFVDALVHRLKLAAHLRERIDRLSGGTVQKLKFATSILHRPALTLLDEPTDGFDWAMYLAFWEIMTELRAEGCAALVVSHLIHDRERFDRIYELAGGTCVVAA